MEMTSPKVPQLAPEQILRAADYEQGSEEDKVALAEFHANGPEPATAAPFG